MPRAKPQLNNQILLKVNEEYQGIRKEFEDSDELKDELEKILDERVIEVIVKKRAAVNSSQNSES